MNFHGGGDSRVPAIKPDGDHNRRSRDAPYIHDGCGFNVDGVLELTPWFNFHPTSISQENLSILGSPKSIPCSTPRKVYSVTHHHPDLGGMRFEDLVYTDRFWGKRFGKRSHEGTDSFLQV
ncbi:hypothetical protein HanPI659440_Chr03g0097791 [Helianthus annuus]|nr:hypothetical protein HanPI659440_Chr03g0097791 [Helianthus annuus]